MDQSKDVLKPTLHHVNIKTTRLQEMIEWYGTVLGAEVLFEAPIAAWMSNDEANHRLALVALPSIVASDDKLHLAGMHHTAFEYESIDALISSYERLKAAGILPGACLHHGLTMSMYYFDPDGNGVELQSDRFGDWAKSSEFMRTDPRFAANPIGTPFDPDDVTAAWRGGIDEQELHSKTESGEFPPRGTFDVNLPLEG